MSALEREPVPATESSLLLAERSSGSEVDDFVSENWETSDLHLRQVAHNTYLLTYTLVQPERRTRRLTVRQGSPEEGWKILFHQGTIVKEVDE